MNVLSGLKNEMKLIYRDPILLMMLLFVVYLALVLKFALPWADSYLATQNLLPGTLGDASLEHYYPIILTFLVVFTGPQMSGAIFGFLMLSDKDDQTIKALMVTPLSSRKYVKNRVIASWAVGSIIILFLLMVINVNIVSLWNVIVISVGSGLIAPIIMLFLGITSAGKVEGMNNSKMVGIFGIILVIAWFVKGNFQLMFGIVPFYWLAKAYWVMDTGNTWLVYFIIGVCYQLVVIYGMSKLFNKKLYKTF